MLSLTSRKTSDECEKIKIGAVVGCTGSGKTRLAIELAKRFDGEIICCDSMQVYKGMDIGTAKPTVKERAQAVHHLVDVVSPERAYSCADYVADAQRVVTDITSRGKLPIFCGGTGLYFDRFLHGGVENEAVSLPEYREELNRYVNECGCEALHAMLKEVDPESAQKIHCNNIKSVIRALEIKKATGEKKSDLDKRNADLSDKYTVAALYPFFNDRKFLYSRINDRVDEMIKQGLADETGRLYEQGVFEKSQTASQAIGYKELLPYIEGRAGLSECVEKLKMSTRRYAKRQNTWFSSKKYVTKIDMDDDFGIKTFENIVNISQTLFNNLLFYDIII